MGRDVFSMSSFHHPVFATSKSGTSLVILFQKVIFASLARVGEEQSLGCALKGIRDSDHSL